MSGSKMIEQVQHTIYVRGLDKESIQEDFE